MCFEVGVIQHEHLFCPPTSFWLCTGFRLCGGASGSCGEDQQEDSLLRAGAEVVVEGFVGSIGGWHPRERKP